MKLHTDKTLYIEFGDFIAAGWKEDTVKKSNLRNGANWQMIKNPTDKRKPMVKYDTLVDKHKEQLQVWLSKLNGCKHEPSEKCDCGNPYTYVAKEPIRDLVKKDFKAESFFLKHRYTGTNGKPTALPPDTVDKYTNEASYLNMLVYASDNTKEVVKKGLNLTVDSFYEHVGNILKAEIELGKITSKFPTSYRRLIDKIAEYKADGYPSLIGKAFGNTRAAKICDEVSESLLLELIAHPNQYDDVLVAEQYNQWAEPNNYKTIDPATVGVWRRKRNPMIKSSREGREEYNKTVRRKVLRDRPSQPTFLWESDDNHLDWWFQGDKANEYRKIKGIIVTDSFNDYVLGYAMTDGSMPDQLVRLAYLDAIHHVKELTGGWYLPFEVKTDQWEIKQLRPFYQSIAHYYDTPVGSKNRGWLENFFGHKDWERSLKIGNNNYTGHNITAKTTGVNLEVVKANRRNWPHISQAANKMQEFVHRLRTMPVNYDRNNKSRQQEWLEAFNAMPAERKIEMTDEQRLLKFGFRHAHQNRITDQGIRPTIGNTTYTYAVPHELYLHNHGKKVDIIYDPYDMNTVLVTDNEGLRFVAESVTRVAGCLADMQINGGRTLLNQILEEAKADAQQITAEQIKRQSTLLDNGIDTETILKLGVSVPKADKQLAEARFALPVQVEAPADQPEEETEFNVHQSIFRR